MVERIVRQSCLLSRFKFDLSPDSGLSSYSLVVEGSEVQSPSALTVHVATPIVAPRLTSFPGSSGKKAQ